MKRLIIDVQILQTSAFDRGMGKYTLSLLREFISTCRKNEYYDEIELLMNKNLSTSKQRVEAIKDEVDVADTVILDLPVNIAVDMAKKYETAKRMVSKLIDKTKKQDEKCDYLITSPFFVDFPAVFPEQPDVGKFSIVYDIIPFKIWHKHRIFPDDIYFNHYKIFLEADRLFTISHAVKNDLVDFVGINSKKITPIDGAAFARPKLTDSVSLELKKPFILFPSAPIVHKNNERAVRAFERFNSLMDGKYTMYITSTFGNEARKELEALSGSIEFTGNISDEELAYAYSEAEILFFPSLTEGLGMPVLEAVEYELPVVCSDVPVLTEISETAFYIVRPTDIESMADGLLRAAKGEGWSKRRQMYKRIKKRYAWSRSAEVMFNGIRQHKKFTVPKRHKLQLVMPHPGKGSPAAALGERAYARLSDRFDVKLLFTSQSTTVVPSYIIHVPEAEVSGVPRLTFQDKGLLPIRLSPARKVKIVYDPSSGNENEKRRQIDLRAVRVVKEDALGLKSWEFTDAKSSRIDLEDALASILEKGTF